MITGLKKNVVSLTLILLMLASTHAVAAVSPTLLEAKKEAEAKGYTFFTTHDEIVAMAKKEGKLRVITGLETANHKPLVNGFKQKYPFITDIQFVEITGTDAFQKSLLEIKAGQAKVDIAFVTVEFGEEFMPYLKKHDILSMAKHGVLKIHPGMIHSVVSNIVCVTSSMRVVAYNRKLISDDKLPAKWEDFLKPEFKGKKFIVELRPTIVAGLVPAWGLERTLDFARRLAAQQPVWSSASAGRINTAVAAGEYSLYCGPNFSTVKRTMDKDPKGSLNYKVIEPVPTRIAEDSYGILNTAEHPYTALLWFEFLASPEGQDIIDKHEPLRASVLTPGSVTEQMTKGKELSMVDWNHFDKFKEYLQKGFAAYGFPKGD